MRNGDSFQGTWMVADDFNAVLEQKDKAGGRPITSSSSGRFRGMIDANGLIDLSFCAHAYTWNNKRAGKANIQERLDRAFTNGDWRTMFPQAVVTIRMPSIRITNQF